MAYDHKAIEKKWQERWAKERIFEVGASAPKDKKRYVLDMFPYPSGAGLHVGHPEGYTATDIYSRYLRMKGFSVLHPMGWDAFGLPAENYAIKTGVHPKESIEKNIKTFRRQINSLGFSYDWSREINTASPDYYRWTQWLFLQLYKAGLAYKKNAPVNWCDGCQTVLANEQVVLGACERCGHVVVQKDLEQWFFKITGNLEDNETYPERLINNLDGLDWPEPIKHMQRNWIGKSEGAEIQFQISDVKGKMNDKIKMPNFVLLHGYQGSPDSNFKPWLKKELEARGYNVQAPALPNPDEPRVMEQVQYVLDNVEFDENTVLLGHSLGAPVALKVVEALDHPIKKLISAAGFIEPDFSDHERPFAKTFDWRFDFKRIKKNARSIVYLRAKNDTAVPGIQTDRMREKLGGRIVDFEAADDHICGEIEPETLAACVPIVRVFTTRPDTLYGATYIVLSPEHSLLSELKDLIENWKEIEKYQKQASGKSALERTDLTKEKTGVELKGVMAVNPATNEEIPIWIADYVLSNYGTGAIMAVPAHDERDFRFAKKFDLPIRQVIAPETGTTREQEEIRNGGCGIVFDPKTQMYAVARWNVPREKGSGPWYGLFSGGVEGGEDMKDGVLREIEEESGLFDFQHVEEIETAFAHYRNNQRNVNRVARATCYLVVLGSTQTKERKLEDHEDFEVAWMSGQDLLDHWGTINKDGDVEHWIRFLKQAIGRALDLGFDTTSNPHVFVPDAHIDRGILIGSGEFDGMGSEEAKWKITEKVGGRKSIQYKLRDWLISRQRYWGAPIPIIYCDKCGEQPVPEDDLPVVLPDDVDFRPKGESPLARSKSFHSVKCPKCKNEARRESDTMDTFVDSSWYFLRYTDSQNKKEFASEKAIKTWMPVDVYVGGAEHAVLHLMYARFITMALNDLGHVDFEEPFLKLRNQGLIMGEDGYKMSKNRGNVINPDDVVSQFGADTMRMYEMFMGPLEDAKPWSTDGMIGIRRFLDRVWNMQEFIGAGSGNKQTVEQELHRTIQKTEADIESFGFNTAIAQCMIFVNAAYKERAIEKDSFETFLKVLHPFAPHITNELWEHIGNKTLLEKEPWPSYDPALLESDDVVYAVQINGKVRGQISLDRSAPEEDVVPAARECAAKYLEGKKVIKHIFVKERLVNFVVAE